VAIAAYPCVWSSKACSGDWFEKIPRLLLVLSFTLLLLPLSVLIFHIRAIDRGFVRE
jgi:hypothetical protein